MPWRPLWQSWEKPHKTRVAEPIIDPLPLCSVHALLTAPVESISCCPSCRATARAIAIANPFPIAAAIPCQHHSLTAYAAGPLPFPGSTAGSSVHRESSVSEARPPQPPSATSAPLGSDVIAGLPLLLSSCVTTCRAMHVPLLVRILFVLPGESGQGNDGMSQQAKQHIRDPCFGFQQMTASLYHGLS